MTSLKALETYRSVKIESVVPDASPHHLVKMMYTGLRERISAARGAIEREDTARKGELISESIAIIDSLRASLDRESGGEIADNLAGLYDFMERHLLRANLESNAGKLAEVATIVGELEAAWTGIEEQADG